jgi:hypothetical protein
MPQDYADFPSLRFERPAPGVLRVVLDGPGLNAVDHVMEGLAAHREMGPPVLTGPMSE